MTDLGRRLKEARLEAGLSQRQLGGEKLTRNMLSLIENGAAAPSLDTLSYLAARLGKPVSYFLEEQTVTSPNQEAMSRARAAYQRGDAPETLAALEGYREPDPVFDQEYRLLSALSRMDLAQAAVAQGRRPYAVALLDQAARAGEQCAYFGPWKGRLLLLLAQADPERIPEAARALPSLDPPLLLLAQAAMDGGDPVRCAACLDAALDREGPDWNLLRGQAYLAQGNFEAAAKCLHLAEDSRPAAVPLLEQCYRELGDYKMAYFYACKQKK